MNMTGKMTTDKGQKVKRAGLHPVGLKKTSPNRKKSPKNHQTCF